MNFTGLWGSGDLCVNISGVFSQFSLNMIVRGLGKLGSVHRVEARSKLLGQQVLQAKAF